MLNVFAHAAQNMSFISGSSETSSSGLCGNLTPATKCWEVNGHLIFAKAAVRVRLRAAITMSGVYGFQSMKLIGFVTFGFS